MFQSPPSSFVLLMLIHFVNHQATAGPSYPRRCRTQSRRRRNSMEISMRNGGKPWNLEHHLEIASFPWLIFHGQVRLPNWVRISNHQYPVLRFLDQADESWCSISIGIIRLPDQDFFDQVLSMICGLKIDVLPKLIQHGLLNNPCLIWWFSPL